MRVFWDYLPLRGKGGERSMDFSLTETQELLRKSARAFLAERATPSHVRHAATSERGYNNEFWRDVAGLGWTGLIIPERYGGAGMTFADMAVLLEEWGAALAPGPFVETAVIGAAAITSCANEEQKREYLPRMAEGSLIVAPALLGEAGDWSLSSAGMAASVTQGGWALRGARHFVNYADSAGLFIMSGTLPGVNGPAGAFLAPRPVMELASFTRMATSGGVPTFKIEMAGARFPADARLETQMDGLPVLDRMIQMGAVARSLQMAGAARRVLELTVQYVSGRKQFGRPVGSFQAVQHKCADMAVSLQGARHTAYRAAWAISEGRPAVREAAIAKLSMNEALSQICSTAHQCFGAIGFTWEHDLHLFTRRAVAWRAEYGDTPYHRGALANALGL